VPRALENVSMVVRSQMWREQTNGRDVQRSIGQQVHHERESACRPRGLDPAICRMLRQVERLRAVGEERRVAFTEIQPSCIHFGEQRDEMRGRCTFLLRRASDVSEKLAVGEVCGKVDRRHAPL
jgi:hypothetical protein